MRQRRKEASMCPQRQEVRSGTSCLGALAAENMLVSESSEGSTGSHCVIHFFLSCYSIVLTDYSCVSMTVFHKISDISTGNTAYDLFISLELSFFVSCSVAQNRNFIALVLYCDDSKGSTYSILDTAKTERLFLDHSFFVQKFIFPPKSVSGYFMGKQNSTR